jgi:hypothetical protein
MNNKSRILRFIDMILYKTANKNGRKVDEAKRLPAFLFLFAGTYCSVATREEENYQKTVSL